MEHLHRPVIRTVVPVLQDVDTHHQTNRLSVTNDMSGFVAHNLSGLIWSLMEVTDETDGDASGEPEDAI